MAWNGQNPAENRRCPDQGPGVQAASILGSRCGCASLEARIRASESARRCRAIPSFPAHSSLPQVGRREGGRGRAHLVRPAIRGAFADFAGRFRVAKCVAVCLRTRSEITITVAKNVTVIVNRGSQSMLQCASFQFTPCIKPIFGLQQSSCRRSGIARPPQAIDQP